MSEFQQWFRERLRLCGEELVRRAENINLDGLDAMDSVDISINIPTNKEQFVWPSIHFTFNLGELTFVEALNNGEIEPYPPTQNREDSADDESER